MFGSKNRELTRKYDSNWFDSITLRFQNSSRVAYSTNPMPTNTSASTTASRKHWTTSHRDQRTVDEARRALAPRPVAGRTHALPRVGHDAGRDHDVERQQQVGRRPT